uniref:Geminin coiled-coil domain containing n=1 Tax=Anolis carolinensis TaxID=28377 RepID=A0A803TS42_ANOCA|nr:PREDICTED: geminin coiled-coil domain-containing protein 1 isoform X2 [Anolis carolinensis]|eukprot:XP_003226580.1 PREDICTED: geminin coiled-coil domain-containing protein 1 isoform X2 [Anolis carolinensis]
MEGPWMESAWDASLGLLQDQVEGEEEEASSSDGFCSLETTLQEDLGTSNQLCTQLYRNKQLQDTLLQKEEELARLQEENNHLRQFLNSALVKQLEEKTKKLLLQNGQSPRGVCRTLKRPLKAESPVLSEASHPTKTRRNLLAEFTACEEERSPGLSVDSWVLKTLGLKDLNTIDDDGSMPSTPVNFSALTPELFPGDATDLGIMDGPPEEYPCTTLPSIESANIARNMPPYLPPFPAMPCYLPLNSSPSSPLPCSPETISLPQTDMAFTASLSPHCNVRTHTFRQGQAFVRRDEDGGWKLTWVPKQPE